MSSIIALAISGVAAVVNYILPPSRELLEERYLNEAKDLYDLEPEEAAKIRTRLL